MNASKEVLAPDRLDLGEVMERVVDGELTHQQALHRLVDEVKFQREEIRRVEAYANAILKRVDALDSRTIGSHLLGGSVLDG